MSTKISTCDTANLPGLGSNPQFGQKISRMITNAKHILKERVEGKKGVKQLAQMDDRMLKDIGLIRADVERLMLSQEPEKSLKELNEEIHH